MTLYNYQPRFRMTGICALVVALTILTSTAVQAQFCQAVRASPWKCAHPGAKCSDAGGKGRCVNLSDGECECAILGREFALILQGRVLDNSNSPVPNRPVDLTYEGKTYYSHTDESGNYEFHAPMTVTHLPQTSGQVTVGNTTKSVPIGSSTPVEIRLP